MRFYVPTDLRIGDHIVSESGDALSALGRRCLVVTGQSSAKRCGALDDVLAALEKQRIGCRVFDGVRQNPTVAVCQQAGQAALSMNADFILGIGGGSVLDAAKAIAVFAKNPALTESDLYAYAWQHAPLPVVCVGTTAGTGSEVTPVSVLTDTDGRKRSIRADALYPTLSLGDARYLASLPPTFTASCAVDAAAHCIESYFAKTATAISRMFAVRGSAMLSALLPQLQQLTDKTRESLYLASVYGGYAISVTGTAFPHAMGYFLTEQYHVPHGTACGVYLPAFLRYAASVAPQDADAFAAATGRSVDGWCSLLESYTPPCGVTLSAEAIEALRPRFVNNSGIARTPGHFDDSCAVQTLKNLFGE